MRMSCILEKDVRSVRGDLIRAVLLESPLCDLEIETDLLTDVESLKSFIACQEMPFELGDISDMVLLDGWLVRALLRFRHVDRQCPGQSGRTATRCDGNAYLNSPTILLAVSPFWGPVVRDTEFCLLKAYSLFGDAGECLSIVWIVTDRGTLKEVRCPRPSRPDAFSGSAGRVMVRSILTEM
jgi:hypothetical protein